VSDYLAILKNEFEAGDDSFLIKIRIELNWDKAAFRRLTDAMLDYCRNQSHGETLERWLAHGFWYIPDFTRSWTTHPSFPRIHEAEYYEKAYQRLDALDYWFFVGESPFIDDTGFAPLQ